MKSLFQASDVRPKMLITGVSSGIGFHVYQEFLANGWEVWGTTRHGKSMGVLDQIEPNFRSHAHTIDLNLEDLAECDSISKSFGADLEVVILSASDFGRDCYFSENSEIDSLKHIFSVNVFSNIVLINNLLPKIKSHNFGKLVFISTGNASIGGNANNEMFGYKITKTAMNQVIRTMSYSNIQKNIISVSLNPGWVKTKMGGLNAPLTPEDAASRIFDFVKAVNVTHNGKFLNTDLTELPW